MRKLLLLSCLFLYTKVFSQTFSYIHYDEKDGLAGNTVYSICQDKDGFLWFATENGLSVFDGVKFRNLTVKDGLYDNEVMKVFCDLKGRIWILTFNKKPAFYYDGILHNMENDSSLARMKFSSNIFSICESKEGSIEIGDGNFLFELSADNRVTNVSSLPVFAGKEIEGSFANMFGRGFCIVTKPEVFKYEDGRLSFFYRAPKKFSSTYLETKIYPDGHRSFIQAPAPVITTTNKGAQVEFIGTNDGAYEMDKTSLKPLIHYLTGEQVSRVFRDMEGCLWFSTFGSGIYKLPSKNIITYTPADAGKTSGEIFSIYGEKGKLIAGESFSKVMMLHNFSDTNSGQSEYRLSFETYRRADRVMAILRTPSDYIFGLDNSLVRFNNGQYVKSRICPVKSLSLIDTNYIMAGTGQYVFKIRISDLKVIDTLWTGRCTSVLFKRGTYYIGTLAGLYEVIPGKPAFFAGSINNVLSRRINDMKVSTDGTIWVATNDAGIVAYKERSVIKILNDKNFLNSNICKTLFLSDSFLLAGTDKGINKYYFGRDQPHVINYSAADGLPSDLINSIYAEGPFIWVASPLGVTRIEESKLQTASMCNLKLFSVSSSDKNLLLNSPVTLPYTDNNIRFSFTAVSFHPGGSINYYYRLRGLNDNWNITTDNDITYRALNQGNYVFELYAVNKANTKSNIVSIPFLIKIPFWRTGLFYILIVIVSAVIFFFIINRRNNAAMKKIKQKADLEFQLLSLEQQALIARMSPHFIFNCLNSIQHYILTDQKETANKYLSGFATLVRKTMEYSEKKNIMLSEDIGYLTQYLEMEKMRFGKTFSYETNIDPSVDADHIEIPALLIQPYVENSINHGIRNLLPGSRPGKVSIYYNIENGILFCRVEDNGIGRGISTTLKSETAMRTHTSKSTALTQKRADLLNLINNTNIFIETTDMADAEGNVCGTIVLIKIPLTHAID